MKCGIRINWPGTDEMRDIGELTERQLAVCVDGMSADDMWETLAETLEPDAWVVVKKASLSARLMRGILFEALMQMRGQGLQ